MDLVKALRFMLFRLHRRYIRKYLILQTAIGMIHPYHTTIIQRKHFETVDQRSARNTRKDAPDDTSVGDNGYGAFLSPFRNGRPATVHPVMKVVIALPSGNANIYKVRHPG